jgi:hypothetical protein
MPGILNPQFKPFMNASAGVNDAPHKYPGVCRVAEDDKVTANRVGLGPYQDTYLQYR